jgi:ubiquinone/menaquinone biosynthesis C-methylase UbiE
MQRERVTEWLDSDQGAPHEVRASLRDLDRINRWFGGVHTTRKLLRKIAQSRRPQSCYRVLDVAGATSRVVALAAQLERIDVDVVTMDLSSAHLSSRKAIVGNALALPFTDGSFDVVHCCLFLHHLSVEEASRFLQDALRIARIAVAVNDLRRTPGHLALVRATSPFLFSRITRHDAAASVRNAFDEREIRGLMSQAAASSFELERCFLYRMAGVLWR